MKKVKEEVETCKQTEIIRIVKLIGSSPIKKPG
jgi:hypothetical protein